MNIPASCTLLGLTLLLFSQMCFAQHRITGVVRDAETGEELQFANIWLRGTQRGTTTDRDGRFILSLETGEYAVVASYIGYESREILVRVPSDKTVHFNLHQSSIEMPTVTITPEDNPALRIIRNAIEQKEKRRARLKNYNLTSHSKLLVRVRGALDGMVDSSGNGGRATVGISGGDEGASTTSDSTSERLPIILETQTEAWWAAPDRYKEIITARKQSAMIPAPGNLLISQFFIVDFSQDAFSFNEGTPVPGPISERGLRSYYYRLVGTTTLDNMKLHQIEVSPLSDYDPLFEGTIYIADESWALAMVDLRVNNAGRPLFFDSLAFRQHFRLFDNEFWQPVDVVIDAGFSVPIVNVSIDIEGLSVLQDWRINQSINEDFFDRTRIKVLKEADERDSVYWATRAKLPSSELEQRAYLRADSISAHMDAIRYRVDFGDVVFGGVTGSDAAQFTFPGILSLYHFNPTVGHAISGSYSLRMPDLPLRRIDAGASYGFSDARLKYEIGGRVHFLRNPEVGIALHRYYQLDAIDNEVVPFDPFQTTLATLFWKYDPRDYFYRDGWRLTVDYDPFLLFPATLDLSVDRFRNAATNTQQSIFRRDWSYRDNPPINEGSIVSLNAGFTYDGRDFIDNAGVISRLGRRNHIPSLYVGLHSADLDEGQWEFATWAASLHGHFDLGVPGEFSYRFRSDIADAALPTQMLFNLHGSVPYLGGYKGFRTLAFREFGGDQRVTAHFSYNIRDWLFRTIGMPLLGRAGIGLELFASGGWSTLTPETRVLQTVPVREAKRPFWEAGFGLDNILSVFRIDVAWRLNHFHDGRNFFIGLHSALFM